MRGSTWVILLGLFISLAGGTILGVRLWLGAEAPTEP